MRFSLNLRYIFTMYCCRILENINIIGPYKEEIWTPKHWACNITTGRQLCPKTFGGRCIVPRKLYHMANVPHEGIPSYGKPPPPPPPKTSHGRTSPGGNNTIWQTSPPPRKKSHGRTSPGGIISYGKPLYANLLYGKSPPTQIPYVILGQQWLHQIWSWSVHFWFRYGVQKLFHRIITKWPPAAILVFTFFLQNR